MDLRILQINTNRSKTAMDLAMATAKRKKCDMIVIAEPNKNATKNKKRNVYTNEILSASIVNVSDRHTVRRYNSGKSYVCIETDTYVIYSVYIGPNCEQEIFEACLEEIQDDLTRKNNASENVVLAGDFNAKNVVWGGSHTDKRGRVLSEWIHSQDMTLLNDGRIPTCRNKTYVDLTLVGERVAKLPIKWEVMEDETLSDHSFVTIQVETSKTGAREKQRWKYGTTDNYRLNQSFQEIIKNKKITETAKVIKIIQKVYKTETPKVKCDDNYNIPYWWTDKIQKLITETKQKRRGFQRATGSQTTRERLKEEYKEAKRNLSLEILQSKRTKWIDTCNELENDIFGDGFKIVKKQLKIINPKTNLTREEKTEVFKKLFITEENTPFIPPSHPSDAEKFTEAEILEAAKRIKTGKAPGPDGLPPEVIKTLIKENVEFFTEFYNSWLNKNEFPKEWKSAKLILIEKPKKNDGDQTTYRPICLLDVLGKVYEALILERLNNEISLKGGLHPNQYGFRKKRSTIDAIERVVDIAKKHKNKWCAMVLVDVKNAFNTAQWSIILEKLKRRGVSQYLLNVIGSYFTGRTIAIENGNVVVISGGVPQGSILGPTLWNVLYDDVMEMKTANVTNICYADDLAVIATAEKKEELVKRVNGTLQKVSKWMEENKLEIAPEKSEAIILNARRKIKDIQFEVNNKNIELKSTVKYLGVTFDRWLLFGDHIQKVCTKAERTIRALQAVLPNINGPKEKKKRVLHGAVASIVMYGAPMWSDAMRVNIHKDRIRSTQRAMALRICSAYRSVSYEACTVVAGVIPWALLAEERKRIFDGKQETDREAERNNTMERWQSEWENTTGKAEWTKALIKDIRPWTDRTFGQVNYEITQCLTGHGSFMSYLKRIGKRKTTKCMYCEEEDDAAHTLFVCERWHVERFEANIKTSRVLSPDNIVGCMLESKENWEVVESLMTQIMKRKAKDEKDLEETH